MLQTGANAQAHDKNGTTLLHYAVLRCPQGDYRIIDTLLKFSAKLSATDLSGHTPAHTAACIKRPDILWHLTKTQQLNIMKHFDSKGRTPFMVLAHNQSTEKDPVSMKLLVRSLQQSFQLDTRLLAPEQQHFRHLTIQTMNLMLAGLDEKILKQRKSNIARFTRKK